MTKLANLLSTTQLLEDEQRAAGRISGVVFETSARLGTSGSNITLTSGKEHLTAVWLPAGLTALTGLAFHTSATGFTTPTIQFFTLRDASGALLKQTTDDGSTAWAANTRKALSWSGGGTYQPAGGALYYVGIAVAAATPGNMSGANVGAAVAASGVPYPCYISSVTVSTGTADAAAPFASVLGGRLYAELLG